MSKFNVTNTRPAVTSPIVSETTPSGRTYEGGAGLARDTKSELFLLAVANMVGERTYYEESGQRDDRFAQLVQTATLQDPDWTARLLKWLRSDANMRTASLVGAAEFTKARLTAGEQGMSRQVIDSVLQRADEPGEFLAYWTSTHGRALPKPVKRGVADAARRLYHERSLLKWDSDARGFRFGDVLELAHPTPVDEHQGDLFEHAIDRRHNRDGGIPASQQLLHRRAVLMKIPVAERADLLRSWGASAPERLADAGMTWESVAGWLQGPMIANVWEALAPTMGYMALLRQLRNFDEAGVSDEVAGQVAAKLSDPAEVARSRQLPMRFLSAYRAAPSLRWGHALEKAITHSLANVPKLDGRTLVLVDTSGSMDSSFSKDGTLMRWDAAAVFGIALGQRCEYADVVSFSSGWQGRSPTKVFPLQKGESLLRSVERWKHGGYFLNGGTDTEHAIRNHLRPGFHDRLVILTDEQATSSVDHAVPRDLPLYTWNLAGYRYGHAPSGSNNRHTFGGLSDSAFKMIPLLEAGRSASWPF